MKDILKKWWFWIIILAIVFIIGFTAIMLQAFNMVKGEVGNLAIKVQSIYEDATIYTSAGGNTLVLELNNWDNKYVDKLNKIINTVKETINNNELQSYSKFVTLTYLNSNDKDNVLFIKTVYNMPEFTEESVVEYIIFDEYQSLYNTLNYTMEGFTDLFNGIY